MSLIILFGVLAIVCFLANAAGFDSGKGIPVGLIFLTVMLIISMGGAR